jgi:hypothetical protein
MTQRMEESLCRERTLGNRLCNAGVERAEMLVGRKKDQQDSA